MKNTEVQIKHSNDALWWVIAALCSLAALRLRDVMALDTGARELACEIALFLAGLVVAAYRPRRAWRWALAGFVALGLGDFVHLGNDPHFPEVELHDVLSHLAHGAPDWALHTLPILVGAYVGAYLSREDLP